MSKCKFYHSPEERKVFAQKIAKKMEDNPANIKNKKKTQSPEFVAKKSRSPHPPPKKNKQFIHSRRNTPSPPRQKSNRYYKSHSPSYHSSQNSYTPSFSYSNSPSPRPFTPQKFNATDHNKAYLRESENFRNHNSQNHFHDSNSFVPPSQSNKHPNTIPTHRVSIAVPVPNYETVMLRPQQMVAPPLKCLLNPLNKFVCHPLNKCVCHLNMQ